MLLGSAVMVSLSASTYTWLHFFVTVPRLYSGDLMSPTLPPAHPDPDFRKRDLALNILMAVAAVDAVVIFALLWSLTPR